MTDAAVMPSSNFRATLHAQHLQRRAKFAAAARKLVPTHNDIAAALRQIGLVEDETPAQETQEQKDAAMWRGLFAKADAMVAADAAVAANKAAAAAATAKKIETTIKIHEIQTAVAKHYGVTVTDMISARRTANVVRPRQVGMYLAKTLTLRSLPEIGRRFGGRDHTTVLHGVRKIGALIEKDSALADTVEALQTALAS